jgi:hypothetical protein
MDGYAVQGTDIGTGSARVMAVKYEACKGESPETEEIIQQNSP